MSQQGESDSKGGGCGEGGWCQAVLALAENHQIARNFMYLANQQLHVFECCDGRLDRAVETFFVGRAADEDCDHCNQSSGIVHRM